MTDQGMNASRTSASNSAPQDDARERELIELFNLEKPPGSGTSDTDAPLYLDGNTIPFELKSTSASSGSVTTVRDLGPGHIERWKGKHWLIGVYEGNPLRLKHTIYASPDAMNPWISEKAEYVKMDFELAMLVPR